MVNLVVRYLSDKFSMAQAKLSCRSLQVGPLTSVASYRQPRVPESSLYNRECQQDRFYVVMWLQVSIGQEMWTQRSSNPKIETIHVDGVKDRARFESEPFKYIDKIF